MTAIFPPSPSAAIAATARTDLVQTQLADWTLLAAPADSLLQAGHNWVANSFPGASNLNYTGDFYFGTQCIRVLTVGVAANVTQITLPRQTAPLDLTGKHLRVFFKIVSGAHFANIRFIVGSGATQLLNNINFIAQASGDNSQEFARPGEWCALTLSPLQGHPETGTIDWTAIQDFRFQVGDDGTGSTEVLFGGFVIEENDPSYPNGVVTFTFDDSYEEVYANAKPILDTAGMSATIYHIADFLDTSGRLTTAQIKQMQQQGWDIAGHAGFDANHGHANGLTGLTAAQQTRDFQAQRGQAITLGIHGAMNHMAYPQGYYDLNLLQNMKPWYSAARTTVGDTTDRAYETLPVADPMRLRCYFIGQTTVVSPNGTFNSAEWAVDRCKKYGGWLIFYGHKISNDGSSLSLPIASFQTLVNYIAAAGVPVRTVADVIGIGKAGAVQKTDVRLRSGKPLAPRRLARPLLITPDATISILSANDARGARVIIGEDGTLMDLYCSFNNQAGNISVAIADTKPTTRTILWTSGPMACPAGGYQKIGDPGLAVKAGDHLDFLISTDTTTMTMNGKILSNSFSGQLPSVFSKCTPLGGNAKYVYGLASAHPFVLGGTFLESAMAANASGPWIIARVA